MTTPLDAAMWWIKAGYSVVPVPARSKNPDLIGWQEKLITTEDQARQYFNGHPLNLGIHDGYQGVADVDLDSPQACLLATHFLPETGLTFGRASKPCSHWLYRSDPKVRTRQFRDPIDKQKMIVELRGVAADGHIGMQTIVPPSTHETGELVEFTPGTTRLAQNVDAPVLVRAVSHLAATALLAKHWPKEGARHVTFLALAGWLARAAWNRDDILRVHSGIYKAQWGAAADLRACASEVDTTLTKLAAQEPITGYTTLTEYVNRAVLRKVSIWLSLKQESAPINNGKVPEPNPDYKAVDLLKHPLTDSGNAERMAVLFSNDVRYCYQRKRFLMFDGRRWNEDSRRTISYCAKKTARLLYAAAADLPETTDEDKEFKESVERFARKSESARTRKDTLECLTAEQENIPLSESDLDCDPLLLNVLNGTLDLQSGELREHCRADYISKLIPIEYDPTATCPVFLRFLDEIMAGNAEMIRCLQLYFGCAATGQPEKAVFFFFGAKGNNGKTTLLEIIRAALGEKEYGGQIAIESLMARPREANNNAITSDLADLRGCRFVTASEVEQGQRLSLARVKYITGLGEIKARRLAQDWITFKPTHKIFIEGNTKPLINDPDDPVWNRLKCVPFTVTIPDDRIDTKFPRKLHAELPGILRWIVDGAQQYLSEGLPAPPEVLAAGVTYREECDKLKPFLDERCRLDPANKNWWISVSQLWPAYATWAEAAGEKHPLDKRVFEERIQRLGVERAVIRPDGGGRAGHQLRVWIGIRFRTDEDEL